jgi:hypothetical protein
LPRVTSGGFGSGVGSGVSVGVSPGSAVAVGVAVCWAVVASSSSSPLPPAVVRMTTATIAMTAAIARNVRRCVRDTRRESSLLSVLVRRDGVVIGQPAHAWVSGQVARACGNAAFPAPSPREPFCLAAEQHDVGWADADLAPDLGSDGRPLSFMEQPRLAHVAIWRAAASRLLAQSRYAALLVSLHGTSLYERVEVTPSTESAIRTYLAEQRALQERLVNGLDAEEVDRNRRLLLALDRLSLFLCYGRGSELEDVPSASGAATLRLEPASDAPRSAGTAVRDDAAVPSSAATARFVLSPWPFAAPAVVVGCEGRLLEGSFGSDAELRAALEAAPWVPLRWELSPG